MKISLAGPLRFDQITDLLDEAPPSLGPVPGGSPVALLARGLRSRGHEVHVATLARGLRDPMTLTGPGLRIDVGRYREGGRARDAFAVERTDVTASLRAARSDVVHAQWTYEFALAAIASGLPSVVTVRDWAPVVLRYHPHPYRVVRLGMAAVVLRRAPVLTVTSPYMRDLVQRWARRESTLVPNAIPDADFEDVAGLPWPRDRTAPRLVAVNVGFGKRKNVATLLRALAEIRSRHPGTELELIGDGHGPGGAAEAFARSAGMATDGVRFTGRLPYADAMDRVRSADVFVHPSREESFGLVLVEAMARGVPVVAGRSAGAVPWVCAEGEAGVLVDVESPAAIAGGIDRVLGDREATRARIVGAAEQARRRFGLDAVCAAYEEVYARCTARVE